MPIDICWEKGKLEVNRFMPYLNAHRLRRVAFLYLEAVSKTRLSKCDSAARDGVL